MHAADETGAARDEDALTVARPEGRGGSGDRRSGSVASYLGDEDGFDPLTALDAFPAACACRAAGGGDEIAFLESPLSGRNRGRSGRLCPRPAMEVVVERQAEQWVAEWTRPSGWPGLGIRRSGS